MSHKLASLAVAGNTTHRNVSVVISKLENVTVAFLSSLVNFRKKLWLGLRPVNLLCYLASGYACDTELDVVPFIL